MSELRQRIADATSAAVRGRERERVKALRLVNAAIKQAEIDGRGPGGAQELADGDVVAVLARMRKQRQDSLRQFKDAGRDDLAAVEQFELDVIAEFMPQALSEEELRAAVAAAVAECAATSMRDMGRVMGVLKIELAGRADMALVSRLVRAALGG